MRIACLGGGPAGLYFAILMKKANPAHDITVIDRNAADNTFGWGIVFSDKTMDGFRDADEQVVNEIEANFHHWDDIDVFVHWQGLWKKDADDPGLRQRGHTRLQWVGTKSILLRGVQGDSPFGMKARQTTTDPPRAPKKK